MKDAVKHRIDTIKTISIAGNRSGAVVSTRFAVEEEDNLSKSIRTKKDAEIFQAELVTALKQAKNNKSH